MADTRIDPAISKARKLFQHSGKSLDDLGTALGLSGETARKGAWQLLNKVNDPKISTLRALARALNVPIEELVSEGSHHGQSQPVKRQQKQGSDGKPQKRQR
jgi:transcriptional regulator with XRE-family HTH domain